MASTVSLAALYRQFDLDFSAPGHAGRADRDPRVPWHRNGTRLENRFSAGHGAASAIGTMAASMFTFIVFVSSRFWSLCNWPARSFRHASSVWFSRIRSQKLA